jgi:hypothetical protein
MKNITIFIFLIFCICNLYAEDKLKCCYSKSEIGITIDTTEEKWICYDSEGRTNMVRTISSNIYRIFDTTSEYFYIGGDIKIKYRYWEKYLIYSCKKHGKYECYCTAIEWLDNKGNRISWDENPY